MPTNFLETAWPRIERALNSGYVWLSAATAAGAAVFVGSLVQGSLGGAVDFASGTACSVREHFRPAPKAGSFLVVIAKLRGDDGSWRSDVSQALASTKFPVINACNYGPNLDERDGGDLSAEIRQAADRQLSRYGGDILIFGGVRQGHLHLRFADKGGYCSQEEVTYSVENKMEGAAKNEFEQAVSNSTVNAIISDCEGKKADKMAVSQLQAMVARISKLANLPHLSGELRTNIEWSKAWAKAELAYRTKGTKIDASFLDSIVSASMPDEYRAVQLYAAYKFAGDHRIRSLYDAAEQELADLHNLSKPGTVLWSCTAILSEDLITPQKVFSDNREAYLWYSQVLQGFLAGKHEGCNYDWMSFLARYRRDISSLEFKGDDYHQRLLQAKNSLQFTIATTKKNRNITNLNVNWAELQLADTLWRLGEMEKSLTRIEQARKELTSARSDRYPGDPTLNESTYNQVMASIIAAERKIKGI